MNEQTTKPHFKTSHRAFAAYVAGFALSLILTLAAYLLTSWHVTSRHEALPHQVLVPTLITLAVTQLIVQLIFFLHLGHEPRPRWNTLTAAFAAGVVLIVVVGSIWIMQNLNYNMHPRPSDEAIMQDEGIYHNDDVNSHHHND